MSKDQKIKKWTDFYNQLPPRNPDLQFEGLGEPVKKPQNCKKTELHARTLTGKKFNYAGPGTCFAGRLARKDKGITYTDYCGKKHDWWYGNPKATPRQIIKADDDFRKCVSSAPSYRMGDSINKFVMNAVFKGKRELERRGILDPTKLTDSEYRKLYGKAKPKQIRKEVKEAEKHYKGKKKESKIEKHKTQMKEQYKEEGKKVLGRFLKGLITDANRP